jgi:hypothetical protein
VGWQDVESGDNLRTRYPLRLGLTPQVCCPPPFHDTHLPTWALVDLAGRIREDGDLPFPESDDLDDITILLTVPRVVGRRRKKIS